MRKDTANAMPIVIASSLLIINLGPELVLVSSDSSAKDSSGQTPLALMKCLCCHPSWMPGPHAGYTGEFKICESEQDLQYRRGCHA